MPSHYCVKKQSKARNLRYCVCVWQKALCCGWAGRFICGSWRIGPLQHGCEHLVTFSALYYTLATYKPHSTRLHRESPPCGVLGIKDAGLLCRVPKSCPRLQMRIIFVFFSEINKFGSWLWKLKLQSSLSSTNWTFFASTVYRTETDWKAARLTTTKLPRKVMPQELSSRKFSCKSAQLTFTVCYLSFF